MPVRRHWDSVTSPVVLKDFVRPDTSRFSSRTARLSEFWMLVGSSTRLKTWMAHRSSTRGTTHLPGTWPPEKPTRCNSEDVSLRARKKKWPLQMRPVLSFWEYRACLLIRQATNKLLLDSLKPLLSHIVASVPSASSLAGNQSCGNTPRANNT